MVEFDKKGNPSFAIKGKAMMLIQQDETVPIIKSNPEIEPVKLGKFSAVPWYQDNDFPQKADLLISGTSVLKRSLGDLTKITLGQGIFPCEVTDTLPSGEEVLKMIKDPLITNQLESYMIRRYLAKTAYDIFSYGSGFVQFVPNLDGSKIVALNPVNALKCRLEIPDEKTGKVLRVLVSGRWPDTEEKYITPYLLLDEVDPLSHLMLLKENGELKEQTVFMHLKNSLSSNDFYPVPNWYASEPWINIANKVPKIINSGMDNVLNITFLIRIPYSYFEKKYPANEYDTLEVRRTLIEADIENLQDKFTSVDNARKALITFFGTEEGEEKWEIEILQPKFSQENFVTSTAADTQIAIATGLNPDLLGLMYGNSKGGSMQRELLLLQYALSWESRQQLADPIEMMLKYNTPGFENLQIRFRNTFLTTLDTGGGTATTLS